MNYDFITINDDMYPECLKEISDPPEKLYYKGNLELLKSERMVAVVGTRNPSSYGKLCCEYMIKKMSKADVTIVSGFAKGIDSIAHKTSLLTGNKTIAVIASGLDIVYPASNFSLYKEIAEKGLAAHWRYKGIKGESGIDEWLSNIRAALENNDDLQLMDQFKMGLYEDEVFVFTPKGELLKFPKGANILDFAYRIHSGLGNKCVGGKINGKNVSFRAELKSGDEVEVITQSNQTPKQEWINIVKTPRAKAKIKLALKDTIAKDTVYAKELLERRLKNRKIEFDESTMMHLIKRMGFKVATDFYKQIADEKLDVNEVIEKYVAVRDYDQNLNAPQTTRSATEYSYDNPDEEIAKNNDDVLVIDRNLKGVDYSLAKCCQPIYGDPVFGFVTVSGGIKIHRANCPNAPELRKRFGYRIVKARWSGKSAGQYSITIKVVGNDDLGIVNNITSIISKEEKIVMRSINIDSHDSLFDGTIVVQLEDVSKLEALMKKLRTVKGVKHVSRL